MSLHPGPHRGLFFLGGRGVSHGVRRSASGRAILRAVLALAGLSLAIACHSGAGSKSGSVKGSVFNAKLKITAGGKPIPVAAALARRVSLFERACRDETHEGEDYEAYRERLVELETLSGGAFSLELAGDETARGMALDLAVESAREGGASSFLLELGGTVYAAGAKASAEPWRISIGGDGSAGKSAICSFPLRDRALAASKAAGSGEVLQVAVAAPSALAAEVFADALLTLGPAAWGSLVAGMPGFDAVFIMEGGYILVTAGIYPYLCLNSENYEVLRI